MGGWFYHSIMTALMVTFFLLLLLSHYQLYTISTNLGFQMASHHQCRLFLRISTHNKSYHHYFWRWMFRFYHVLTYLLWLIFLFLLLFFLIIYLPAHHSYPVEQACLLLLNLIPFNPLSWRIFEHRTTQNHGTVEVNNILNIKAESLNIKTFGFLFILKLTYEK